MAEQRVTLPIHGLLRGFETHYSTNQLMLEYTQPQRNELVKRFRWVSGAYARVLYEAVVTVHPMSLRSLPDMAVIAQAMKGLDRPEVYEQPTNARQITDDAGWTDEDREAALEQFRTIAGRLTDAKRFEHDEEAV
ncbi:MAG: hypothetical protein ACOCVK_02405 [bacterium]